jgi:hypothetical protein
MFLVVMRKNTRKYTSGISIKKKKLERLEPRALEKRQTADGEKTRQGDDQHAGQGRQPGPCRGHALLLPMVMVMVMVAIAMMLVVMVVMSMVLRQVLTQPAGLVLPGLMPAGWRGILIAIGIALVVVRKIMWTTAAMISFRVVMIMMTVNVKQPVVILILMIV